MHKPVALYAAACLALASHCSAADSRELTLRDFITETLTRDTEFESLLIDELELAYRSVLVLPARDLVLGVREEYVSFPDSDRGDAATSIGLTKPFPTAGTEVEARYAVRPNSAGRRPSELTLSLTQPLARNAFGRSTRMLDTLVGIETNVAQYQITEAYEDYLAAAVVAYYEWWAARENLLIGQASYQENQRLLENMQARERKQIALPVDVNKTRIQLLSRREDLVERADAYTNALRLVERFVRHDGSTALRPSDSALRPDAERDFDTAFEGFRATSRTFETLDLLAEREHVGLERATDALLPSLDLIISAGLDGENHNLSGGDAEIRFGLRLEWPVSDTVAHAERDVQRLRVRKSTLAIENTQQRLYTRLRNLHRQIRRERSLGRLVSEKVELARSVLTDESENYSFGKASLNDYIAAVNLVDNNRFALIRHQRQERILTLEWLRLTDQLLLEVRDLDTGP